MAERATMRPARDADLATLMNWFPDAASVRRWGGPQFRFPFDAESFRADCQFDHWQSWALEGNGLEGFGQICPRYGRGHLGFLAVAPGLRGSGLGRRLIEGILQRWPQPEQGFSLFVLADNEPAIRCYRACGFEPADWPADGPEIEQPCLFMVRPGMETAPGPTQPVTARR